MTRYQHLISIYVIKYWLKATWEGKYSFVLNLLLILPHWGNPNPKFNHVKILEAGTEVKSKEECWLLYCSLSFVQIFFFIHPRTTRNCTIHTEWRSSMSIINQDHSPQMYLQTNLIKVFSQLKFPLP